jgi:hypothetical protein
MSAGPVPSKIEMIRVKDLEFDRRNPRLAGYGVRANTPDEDVIEILWEEMAVDEVAMSIAASGYWSQEPLIVAVEKGKNVVIEGNRRLAAVRALLEPAMATSVGTTLGSNLQPEIIATLDPLPAILTTRVDSWRYLGFKHVNGPARWGSYAKAEYIRRVHSEYNISLPDIARQIGDRHRTVQRLYRAMMVLNQAVKQKAYSLDDRAKKNLAFSHLYIGLDYDGFQGFLKLRPEEEESDRPVPANKLDNLKQLLIWLFGSQREKRAPIIHSQNPDLKNLDKVLKSEEACRALLRGSSLDDASVLADPAKDRLRAGLLDAKNLLQTARGIVSEAYEGEEDILRTSGTVAEVAEILYKELETQYEAHRSGKKTKARLTDA